MSMAQFLALLLCAFGLAALLLGLYRPTWVLPSRRTTRRQVLLIYSVLGLLGPLLTSELAQRAAHAQTPAAGTFHPEAAGSGSMNAAGANIRINEEEPAPDSLRAMAQRMLLDLGLGAGHRLRIGRLTLVYEDPVSEAQATALGEFLSHSELGDRGASAGPSRYGQVQLQLRRVTPTAAEGPGVQGAYEVRIATPFSHRQELDPETKAAYQMVGLVASGIAFDGAPVHIQVCTASLRPLLVLHTQLASAPPVVVPPGTVPAGAAQIDP